MICDWCGTEIDSYPQHFALEGGSDCRTAAQIIGRQPVLNLDGNLTHAQIRRRALANLQRTRHRDRLEGRVATNAPPSADPRGRA